MKKQNLLFILLFFINLINAQNVQNYYFSHSIGSYVETSNSATLLTGVRADDAVSVAQNIGFNFVYDGSTFTQFKMSSNGFISFGTGTNTRVTNSFISTLFTTTRPIIAPLWDDLSGTSTNSVAAYELTGSAPNRVLTVEWRNWFWDKNAATAAIPNPTISFQVKLYETTNVVEFLYRQETGSVSPVSLGASIGIGSSNSINFLNLTSVSNPAVSNSSHVVDIITKPLTGQIFSFSPCAPILAPTISSTASSCSSAGTSTISNYSASNTYTFTPIGPTVGVAGIISGLTEGTSYTVIATNGGCSSVASASFSNAAQLPTPLVPTISSTASSCSSAGTSTISNYDASNTYVFTPATSGITIDATGLISGLTEGTSYTVIATNGGCSSVSSASFSNVAQLPTPSVPTISSTATSCSSAGTSTISNYDASNTYVFTPATSGITIDTTGLISGLVEGTSYTVIATNGLCSSVASASFSNAAQLPTPSVPTISSTATSCSSAGTSTISNYDASNTYVFTPATSGITIDTTGLISGLVEGTSYTVIATNGLCSSVSSASFSNAAQLPTPSVPTISSTATSCSSAGTSTISNYDASNTYVFTPATSGITIDATGLISGLTEGTSYTVIATNGGCSSVASASFSNAAQLPTPLVPTISSTASSCSSAGTSTISNYDASNTYVFTPATSGITIDATGLISGLTEGTSYTVIATNGGCSSVSSASFSNVAQLPTPSVPTISSTATSCSSAGTSTISNYDASNTYVFTPATSGITIDATGLISGLTEGTSYTVIATNGLCSSVSSTSFSNAAQLPTPLVPTISSTASSCSSAGTSTISNYDASNTYVFTPATSGITIDTTGLISGLVEGTSYTVIATNGLCSSVSSASFSNAAQLPTPSVPTISSTASSCSSAGASTISNYDASNTYVFTPATSGITIDTTGLISGLVEGTSYTVIATNGLCSSVSSTSFSNAAQLPTPSVPTISSTATSCSSVGTSTISNYDALNTYTFSPATSGITIASSGLISGLAEGTSYTVIATNGGCSSVSSAPFSNSSMLILPTVTASTSLNCLNNQFSININVTSLGVGSFILTDGVSTWPITSIGIINLGSYNFGTSININISDPLNLICNSLVDTFSVLGCPPANDNCANAQVLTPGGVFDDNDIVGTSFAATASVGETAPGCASYLGGDVWYSAVVPASGSLTFELNTNVGGITDGAGAVYSGSCGALVLVDCNDSSSATPNDQPLISVAGRTPGEVLYFRVWESGNDISGTFLVSAYDASLSSGSFDNANFSAYPNPVKDVLNVSYTSEISSVRVINMIGQEVISKNINATSSQIDMSQLSAGTYIVNVAVGDTIKTLKVVKQ